MNLKLEIEKMKAAKSILEKQVYSDLSKMLKKEKKRQKRDLNDKDDLEMMDIIKRHADHLHNL